MPLSVIVLAAGQGTRMRSRLAKVLHPLAGRPLLDHVIERAGALGPDQILVVIGHGGEQVRGALAHRAVQWVEQRERLGTGHAVAQALPLVPATHQVLILYGDVPLIEGATLERLTAEPGPRNLALLTVELADPRGYGRVVRDPAGRVQAIVEEKDASADQRRIREVNTGIMTAAAATLDGLLARLDRDNAQGEYYLTDTVGFAVADGLKVSTVQAPGEAEVAGVNSRSQLARLERLFQHRQVERLMDRGVSFADPERFDLRGTLDAGEDCFIDVGCVFEGEVQLGREVRIEAHCVLRDCRIGDGVVVHPFTHVEGARIADGAELGPYARLRPGVQLAESVKVGNFVELKNSQVAQGSKINHLSYVGDTEIGVEVNVGAGTITCNYDGANKWRTVIGDRAFIGSNASLVAPVTIGPDATIGAGSVICKDAAPGKLTVSRARQTTVDGWRRPLKKPKET